MGDMMTEFEGPVAEEYRVLEWEAGLPAAEDILPLSQSLVTPVLAFAFSISPDPCRSLHDVNMEAQSILADLRGKSMAFLSADFKAFDEENNRDSQVVVEVDADNREGTDSRKPRANDCAETVDSAPRTENSDDPSGRAQKRPRLVWTPQLHKRFVDVVAHLGIKSAVPKTIMQLMNVDGLTRENVASHLQKYRLYLKRIQGLSDDGPSASDQLFASTPVPSNLRESGGSAGEQIQSVPIPMPYGASLMPLPLPMPVFSMPGTHGHGIPPGAPAYHGFDAGPYNMLTQRDWPGCKFAPVVSYPHLMQNDK